MQDVIGPGPECLISDHHIMDPVSEGVLDGRQCCETRA